MKKAILILLIQVGCITDYTVSDSSLQEIREDETSSSDTLVIESELISLEEIEYNEKVCMCLPNCPKGTYCHRSPYGECSCRKIQIKSNPCPHGCGPGQPQPLPQN